MANKSQNTGSAVFISRFLVRVGCSLIGCLFSGRLDVFVMPTRRRTVAGPDGDFGARGVEFFATREYSSQRVGCRLYFASIVPYTRWKSERSAYYCLFLRSTYCLRRETEKGQV